jgi:hypothetical protein
MEKRTSRIGLLTAIGLLLCCRTAPAIETLTLSQPLKSDYYLSDNEIAALNGCSVPAGRQVWLVAGKRISLRGGFYVAAGSRFSAVTGGVERLPRELNLDGDAFADWWELAWFGNLSQAGGGDYDKDGISNISEYLLNTDPTNSASRPSGLFYRYDDLGRIIKVIRIPAQ